MSVHTFFDLALHPESIGAGPGSQLSRFRVHLETAFLAGPHFSWGLGPVRPSPAARELGSVGYVWGYGTLQGSQQVTYQGLTTFQGDIVLIRCGPKISIFLVGGIQTYVPNCMGAKFTCTRVEAKRPHGPQRGVKKISAPSVPGRVSWGPIKLSSGHP